MPVPLALVTVLSAALCLPYSTAASAQDNPFSFLFGGGGGGASRGRVRATRHRAPTLQAGEQDVPLPPPRPQFAGDVRPTDRPASDRSADLDRPTRASSAESPAAQTEMNKTAPPRAGDKSEPQKEAKSEKSAPETTAGAASSIAPPRSTSPDKAARDSKQSLEAKPSRAAATEAPASAAPTPAAPVSAPPAPPSPALATPAPLPPEKPADLTKTPAIAPSQAPGQTTAPSVGPSVAPSGATTAFTPRQPSEDLTCFNRLDGLKATFEKTAIGPQPDNRCTVVQPVKLTGMALPDGSKVAFPDKPTVACVTADAFAAFVHDLLAPLAKGSFNAPLNKVWTGPGLECRSRDHVFGAKLSAHGQGLAIDIAQIGFADGRTQEVGVPANDTESSFETAARAGACGYFHTVLGPGSDAYHRTHWHFDLEVRGREGDTKFCH